MKQMKHDEWLFLVLTLVGLTSFVVMGILNWVVQNQTFAIIEWSMAVFGAMNAVVFWIWRKIDLSTHTILFLMLVLLIIILTKGGMMGMGGMWIFAYPPLAFALRSVKTASWYVSILGLVVAGMLVVEYFGFDVTIYSLPWLIQLCMSYMVVSIMVSIAERAHERMATDLRTFKTAVEQSSEMMIIADPEGQVLWANDASVKVTGFSIQEAVGRKAGILWGKLMDKKYYENLWHKIKIEKTMFVGQIKNHRKNGEHFFSTITIYPLLDEQGEVEYLVATQRDITHEKEVDQMKTDFITLVSHQLRTPLSSMRWNLEMLLAGDLGEIGGKQAKVVEQVYEANSRMIKLVTTLLNISRIESGRMIVSPEEVKLEELVEKTIDELSEKLSNKLQKVEFTKYHSGTVSIDPQLFRQVMQNFLNNARKYSESSSVIQVKLEKDGEWWKISVSDQGCGIPIDEQHKIFGKYFRASNAVKYEADGTGMGLYLNQLIVKMMGGQIGYVSTEGKGSTFWFTLPINGVKPQSGEVRLS